MTENKKKSASLTPIGDILEKALYRYRPAGDLEMVRIWEHWEKAVGRVVAQNAKPAAFRNDTLIVNVSSSVWMQQLQFLEADIISNVNGCLQKERVRKLKFKIARLHS